MKTDLNKKITFIFNKTEDTKDIYAKESQKLIGIGDTTLGLDLKESSVFQLDFMIGKIVKDVRAFSHYMFSSEGNDGLEFTFDDDSKVIFWHSNDCCEKVWLEDISGDLSDIKGSVLIVAEEATNTNRIIKGFDGETWTFYKFATERGSVTVRWCGSSNGFYSESVDFSCFDSNGVFVSGKELELKEFLET